MLCATQNVELIPALYQEELGEGGKTGVRERPEKSGSRRKQELESDTAVCKSSDIKFGSNLVQAAGRRF